MFMCVHECERTRVCERGGGAQWLLAAMTAMTMAAVFRRTYYPECFAA